MSRSLLGKKAAEKVVSAILTESVISLSEAERLIEKSIGHRPARATVCRWINAGRLEAIKLGRQLFTSEQAVHRFVVARTATIVVNSSTQRARGGGLSRSSV
ncbi:MAG: DUF1580 domain-containing protein [Pirellulaceae bacterium]|nr:DUF1580 domain-containing protein [Pirellulaceae bacterium]